MPLFTNHNLTACQSTWDHKERTENPCHMLYNISHTTEVLTPFKRNQNGYILMTKSYGHSSSFMYIHSLCEYTATEWELFWPLLTNMQESFHNKRNPGLYLAWLEWDVEFT